jgi:cytochrome P450
MEYSILTVTLGMHIVSIAFGIRFNVIMNEKVQFALDFDFCTWTINNSMIDPLWLMKRYLTINGWRYFLALYRINTFTAKIIKEPREVIARRGGATDDMNDLLSLYLDKNTFAGENEDVNSIGDTYIEPNDSTLRDVILNMVIAGRDTTAQALSWTFYRMCIHQGIQEKLRTEVLEALKSSGEYEELKKNNYLGNISYETLQTLKYTEAFLMEVLRLHPSVPKEAKCCFQDDILPDGTPVKVGDVVAFLPWCMGRDFDLWGEDCMEFKPERFLDKAKPSPFVFIAF